MKYVYAPTVRRLRDIDVPNNCINIDRLDGRGPLGTLTFSRPLSESEIHHWGLATIDMPRVNYYVYGVYTNGNLELLLRWEKEMPGAYEFAHVLAKSRDMEKDFVDYVVQPIPY